MIFKHTATMNIIKSLVNIPHQEANLGYYLKYLLENNKSNLAPYHNFYHHCVVLSSCFLLTEMDAVLEHEELRALYCAAVFHDFNHSQGLHSDRENVFVSIREWEKASAGLETKEFISKVSDLISYTEYPYDPATVGVAWDPEIHDKQTYMKMILRDADLSQICTDNFFQQNVLGIATEMRIPLKDFLKGQHSFLSSIKWHTPQAKELFDDTLKHVILPELEFIMELTSRDYGDLV